MCDSGRVTRLSITLLSVLGLCLTTLFGSLILARGICAFVPCDAAPIVGLSRAVSGEITATVELCPNRRVKHIDVVDADGTVRWRVSSTQGSTETQYAVGTEPEGFTTDVLLVTEPSVDAWIRLDAAAARYRPERARTGEIYYGGRYFTASEFAKEARDSLGCPSDGPVPGPVVLAAFAGAVASAGVLVARAARQPRRGMDMPPPPPPPPPGPRST